MRITSLAYTRRYNLGPYEHEEINIGAAMEDGDNAIGAIAQLKETVHVGRSTENRAALALPPASAPIVPASAPAPKEEKQAKEKKAPKTETPAPEVPTEKQEEAPAAPAPAPAPMEAKTVSEKPKKTVRKLGTPYDRANNLHKKHVGDILDANFPGWRSNAAKARTVSESLEGQEFLDAEGIVLETFVAKLKELMAK